MEQDFDGLPSQAFAQQSSLTMKSQNSRPEMINIGVQAWENRGSAIKKHTVYLVKGTDSKGPFSVWRRYNQFYELRMAMVRVWPGCLIPTLPSKNPILKHEEEMIVKRARNMGDFVKQMALREYLYYSQEFQVFVRSQDADLSDRFAKWALPEPEAILKRYKSIFYDLQGKEVSAGLLTQIVKFSQQLQSHSQTLEAYRKQAKDLAFYKDRQNKYHIQFFKTMRFYQNSILSGYTEQKQRLYSNSQFDKLASHEAVVIQLTKTNPYWGIYDLLKNQERDAKAFVELIQSIQFYANKENFIQGKIETNIKGINDAAQGKRNIKTLTMKGTHDQIKYQLQVQNDKLKVQKQFCASLKDIIIGVTRYVQIQRYKHTKKTFYEHLLIKKAVHQNNFSQGCIAIWTQLQQCIMQQAEKYI